MSEIRCKTCMYWKDTSEKDGVEGVGICRANPPAVQWVVLFDETANKDVVQKRSGFPNTTKEDACGGYWSAKKKELRATRDDRVTK